MFDDIYNYCNCYKKIGRHVSFECFDTIDKAKENIRTNNVETKTIKILKYMPHYLQYFIINRCFKN